VATQGKCYDSHGVIWRLLSFLLLFSSSSQVLHCSALNLPSGSQRGSAYFVLMCNMAAYWQWVQSRQRLEHFFLGYYQRISHLFFLLPCITNDRPLQSPASAQIFFATST
jgi:hypothetical protein